MTQTTPIQYDMMYHAKLHCFKLKEGAKNFTQYPVCLRCCNKIFDGVCLLLVSQGSNFENQSAFGLAKLQEYKVYCHLCRLMVARHVLLH